SLWSAACSPADVVAYWRQIVTTMRASAPGLRFDWCPTLGLGALPTDQAWPGDAYVDYVGSDVYDQAWEPGGGSIPNAADRWNNLLTQPYGLNWLAEFAAAHGKQITLPEWGLIDRADGHGGGDNPLFIRQMHRWILDQHVASAAHRLAPLFQPLRRAGRRLASARARAGRRQLRPPSWAAGSSSSGTSSRPGPCCSAPAPCSV